MTRPADIPEDVWEAARKAVLPQYSSDMVSYGAVLRGEADTWPVVKVAVRAILAERKRCVREITTFLRNGTDISSRDAEILCAGVTAAIRGPDHAN